MTFFFWKSSKYEWLLSYSIHLLRQGQDHSERSTVGDGTNLYSLRETKRTDPCELFNCGTEFTVEKRSWTQEKPAAIFRYFRKNGCSLVENIVSIFGSCFRQVSCLCVHAPKYCSTTGLGPNLKWMVIVVNIASFGLKITRELQINCY